MSCRHLLLVFALLAALLETSLADDDRVLAWQALHDRGAAGDANAVVDLVNELEAVQISEPTNYVAQAYLGSALTLRSRDLPLGTAKLETLKRGGALMDSAVSASTLPRVRLIRAVNALRLPRIFGRFKIALADFNLLTGEVSKNPGIAPPEEKQAIWWFAGQAFEANGEKARARAAYRSAIDSAPESKAAPLVAESLRNLGPE